MKIFKSLFVTALFAVLSFGCLSAQDINEAIELYNGGIKAFQESQYSKAIADVEKALQIAATVEDEQAPTVKANCEKLIPQLYFSYGKQQIVDKQYAEGLKTLDQAKTLAGKYNDADITASVNDLLPQAYIMKGSNEAAANQPAEAIASYNKALEYDKTNSTLYLRLALAQEQAKDEAAAIASFDHIVTMEGAKPADVNNAKKKLSVTYLRRAVASQKAKKWADVLTDAEKAAGYDGKNMQTQRLIGAAASELKKWDAAIAAYETVVTAEPNAKDKSTNAYRLATAYEGKGNKAKACEYYKQIVADPNYKAFAEAKVKTLCQ